MKQYQPVAPMKVHVLTDAGGHKFLSLKDGRGFTYATSSTLDDRPFLEALAKSVNEAQNVTA